MVIPNERRATQSGAFSAATPTFELFLMGPLPFFRPTALKLAHLEQPNSAPFALLAEKMANGLERAKLAWPGDIKNSVNRPSNTVSTLPISVLVVAITGLFCR